MNKKVNLNRGNNIVGVLLHGVGAGGSRVCAAAVIVDGQAAADVQHGHVGAQLDQLCKEEGCLLHGLLHHTDVGDLRAGMKVEQLEAVQHAVRCQRLNNGYDLRRAQAEFCSIARSGAPMATMPGCEFGTHADHGAHAHVRRCGKDHRQLTVLLQDEDHPDAQLLAVQRLQARSDLGASA